MALRSTPAARCPAPGEASPRPDPRPPAPSLATRNSPPFRLVQAHLVLGLLGMVLFAAGLVWKADALRGHFFQPALLALVHLCVLGWLMPIAIGALHQLVPVVFDVPARGGALVWTALVLYGVGALGLVGHMATYATGTGLVMSAAMLLGGIALYALNLVATLARAKNVTLTGVYVIAALLYLVAGASLGFALAWNLWHPYLMVDHAMWLKAHAHVAAGGFFGLLVMGVAYRLLEMFLVSHGASMRAGWVALVAVNLCLSLLAVNFIFGRRPELTFAACAAGTIGIAAFLVQVRAIFVRRVRRRTDPAWQHTFASMSYLSLALVAGVGVASVALPGVL
ncbi:MAG TPA: hypothetical protein VHF22_09010, partial [Planctomycetota bacterium]|nr:hypothetical protein [Planctomycetota bacterium]